MIKRWPLLIALGLLAYAIWRSSNFKEISAGVAIFLFGMLFLQEGFAAFTGGVLEKFLRASTDKLPKSLLFGTLSTALMQSSSLVSVITISFLSAGLIGLSSGIGIIFGANIGTTTGAWLMAAFGLKVKISAYAMPMLVFGLVLRFQDRKELKGLGSILAGLGFLFLGIHYMKEGFESFQGSFDLVRYAVGGYKGLFLFAGIGVLATVIMQSSHATLMLIIAALAADQITYENALALAVGANIGTTVTAILGAVSSNAEGRRLAGAHLAFNFITALLAIVFISQFRWAVESVSSAVGIAADDWTLKLAVFHTLFNVVGVVVMIPVIPAMVRWLERWVKGAREAEQLKPVYLNEAALQFPDTALEVLLKETAHLFDNAFEIIAHGINIHRHDILSDRPLDMVVYKSRTPFELDVMKGYYESIKVIYNAIVEFATKARVRGAMTDEQSMEIDSSRIVCRHIAQVIKHVSDMRENLVRYLTSDNEHITREYDLFRLRIATILREIYRVRESEDEVEVFMTLTRLKEDAAEADVLADGTLDRLVRDGLITDRMATSLMNDSESTRDIGARLIAVAERMFIVEGTDLKEIGRELFVADEHEG
jgi:phosphate:Na+ symporter